MPDASLEDNGWACVSFIFYYDTNFYDLMCAMLSWQILGWVTQHNNSKQKIWQSLNCIKCGLCAQTHTHTQTEMNIKACFFAQTHTQVYTVGTVHSGKACLNTYRLCLLGGVEIGYIF